MGFPVTIYRSTDVGSPSLGTGKPSEIINILKKCLVTGYGAKSALGWTALFENTSTRNIIFKNDTSNGGSGGCVNIKSQNGSDAVDTTLTIQPCRTATSVTAMTNKGYMHSVYYPSYMAYDVWTLVGTAVGFFFIAGKSVNTSGYASWVNSDERVIYCGDFKSSVAGDVSRFIAYSEFYNVKNASSAAVAPDWPSVFGSNRIQDVSPANFRIYDTDGSTTKYSDYSVTSGFDTGGSEPIILPELACDERIGVWWLMLTGYAPSTTSPPTYKDRNNVPCVASGLKPYIRGSLFGLVELDIYRYADEVWPFYRTFDGAEHLALRSATGGVSTFVNLVEW
jgi:hypothetical protein